MMAMHLLNTEMAVWRARRSHRPWLRRHRRATTRANRAFFHRRSTSPPLHRVRGGLFHFNQHGRSTQFSSGRVFPFFLQSSTSPRRPQSLRTRCTRTCTNSRRPLRRLPRLYSPLRRHSQCRRRLRLHDTLHFPFLRRHRQRQRRRRRLRALSTRRRRLTRRHHHHWPQPQLKTRHALTPLAPLILPLPRLHHHQTRPLLPLPRRHASSSWRPVMAASFSCPCASPQSVRRSPRCFCPRTTFAKPSRL